MSSTAEVQKDPEKEKPPGDTSVQEEKPVTVKKEVVDAPAEDSQMTSLQFVSVDMNPGTSGMVMEDESQESSSKITANTAEAPEGRRRTVRLAAKQSALKTRESLLRMKRKGIQRSSGIWSKNPEAQHGNDKNSDGSSSSSSKKVPYVRVQARNNPTPWLTPLQPVVKPFHLRKLEEQLKRINLPQGWIISGDEIPNLEAYFVTNMTVQRVLVIHHDMHFEILVHDVPVPRSSEVYHNIHRRILRNALGIKRALTIVSRMRVCCGNYEARLVERWKSSRVGSEEQPKMLLEADFHDKDWRVSLSGGGSVPVQ